MSIAFENVTKKYKDICVLDDFSLILPEKGIICIFGPSGCGKTTLVNILAGLVVPDIGRVKGINGKNISFVFQEDRLIPWITAEQNVSAVVLGKDKINIARDMLRSVGLLEFANKKPNELSGGMCRRVALARAFAYDSDIFIMDEPLKGLDQKIKNSIISLIKEKQKDKLIVLITHSIYEALMLSDYIYIVSGVPLKVNNSMKLGLSFNERLENKNFISYYKEKLLKNAYINL